MSMPEIVTMFDVTCVDSATPVCAVNENGFGVVRGAAVVTLKGAENVPTVSTAVLVVLNVLADVTRTVTWSPELTLPGIAVQPPELTRYSPTVIEIGAAALMPVIVTVFEVPTVWTGALCGGKGKAWGEWPSATVVTLTAAEKLDPAGGAVPVPPAGGEEGSPTGPVSPSRRVPPAAVNGPPLML